MSVLSVGSSLVSNKLQLCGVCFFYLICFDSFRIGSVLFNPIRVSI